MHRCLAALEDAYRQSTRGKTPAETLVYMDTLRDALCRGIREPGTERLPELRHQLNELNDVLNRNHVAGASCGRALRKWFIVAALECASRPAMIGFALDMRRRIREVLRHRNDESVVKVKDDLR